MDIVGLCGKIGSGKTTLAKMLVEQEGFIRYAFADKLKEAAAFISGVSLEVFYQYKDREVFPGVSAGCMLQKLGTEVGRAIYEDIWVEALGRQIQADYEDRNVLKDFRVIIDDVRFPNEVEWIRSNGGVVYRVERETASAGSRDESHASETALDAINLPVIPNNGSLEELMGEFYGMHELPF